MFAFSGLKQVAKRTTTPIRSPIKPALEVLEDRTLLSGGVYFEDFNNGPGGWFVRSTPDYQYVHRSSGGVDNSGYLQGTRSVFAPQFIPDSGDALAQTTGNLEGLYGNRLRISFFGNVIQNGNESQRHNFIGQDPDGAPTYWTKTVSPPLPQNQWTQVSFEIDTNWTDAEAEANGWGRGVVGGTGTLSWSAVLHNLRMQEFLYGNSSENQSPNKITGIDNIRIESLAQPDLFPTSLEWNTAQTGVDFGYKVEGAALTQDTTAALYWASGEHFADVIGGPVYSTMIEHPTGDYGPFYVPNAVLGTPPAAATHLLLVTDPDKVVQESNENNNDKSLALADLEATSFDYRVTTSSGILQNELIPIESSVHISSTILNRGAGNAGPFKVNLYISTDSDIDPSKDHFIATLENIAGLAAGQSYTVNAQTHLPSSLPQTYFGKVWLGVVVDFDNEVVETNEDNNSNRLGVDTREVQLYDPVTTPSVRTFQSRKDALRFLALNGFRPPLSGLLSPFDAGWSKEAPSQFSRFNGKTMPEGAFRYQSSNPIFNSTTKLWELHIEGPEPNPRTAWRLAFTYGLDWLAYVSRYHLRID